MLDFLYWKVLSSSWKVSLVRSGEVNLLPILLIDEVNQGSTLWWWVRWLRMYEVTLLQPSTRQQLSDSLSNLPVLTFLYSPWHLLLLIATDRNVPTRSGVICPLRVCIWRWCLRVAFFFVADRALMFDMVVTLFSELPFPFFHRGWFLFQFRLFFFIALAWRMFSLFAFIYIFIFIYIVCVLFRDVFWVIATAILVFITNRFFPDGLFLRSWWFCYFCILCPWCLSVFFPVMD